MVEFWTEQCAFEQIQLDREMFLFKKKVFVDKVGGRGSEKMKVLVSFLVKVLDRMPCIRVKGKGDEDDADIVFTASLKEDSHSLKRAREKQCVYLSPAWLFDSLFVGKFLSFADYTMVGTREEESPSKRMTQKSVTIMGYSSEEEEEEED